MLTRAQRDVDAPFVRPRCGTFAPSGSLSGSRFGSPRPQLKPGTVLVRGSGPASMRCSVCWLDPGVLHTSNLGRRQERVWRAQRLEGKIYAFATSTGGRDRTSRI